MIQAADDSSEAATACAAIAVKPREARVVVSRILRQALWDWGLEPAVGSLVLAAHLTGHDGLVVLDRDWEHIRSSRPEGMSVTEIDGSGWLLDGADCHPFVAAPTVLDHLLRGAGRGLGVTAVSVPELNLFGAISFFGPRLGLTFDILVDGKRATLTARRAESADAIRPISNLQALDYMVERRVWERLVGQAQAYLVPESKVSRSHAGDGTKTFPLAPASDSAESIARSL